MGDNASAFHSHTQAYTPQQHMLCVCAENVLCSDQACDCDIYTLVPVFSFFCRITSVCVDVDSCAQPYNHESWLCYRFSCRLLFITVSTLRWYVVRGPTRSMEKKPHRTFHFPSRPCFVRFLGCTYNIYLSFANHYLSVHCIINPFPIQLGKNSIAVLTAAIISRPYGGIVPKTYFICTNLGWRFTYKVNAYMHYTHHTTIIQNRNKQQSSLSASKTNHHHNNKNINCHSLCCRFICLLGEWGSLVMYEYFASCIGKIKRELLMVMCLFYISDWVNLCCVQNAGGGRWLIVWLHNRSELKHREIQNTHTHTKWLNWGRSGINLSFKLISRARGAFIVYRQTEQWMNVRHHSSNRSMRA